MLKHHKRAWNSLSDLKEYIIRCVPTEKVIEFNGTQLVTDKFTYGLAFRELNISENTPEKC